jgi:hypothetical protein
MRVAEIRPALPRTYNRESPLPPKHYIFNHIPKTGGNSLLAICRGNLEPAEISPHLEDAEIRLMPAARFEHYRLITGHFSVLAQTGFCRSRYSMTLLREPIRRIFSTYTYWRTERYNPLTAKAKELSFVDFVRYFIDSPAIIQNPYTFHLAAIGRAWPAFPGNESALLAAAKRNLAAFNFVGVCEEFERSVRLLCAQLGWRPPAAIPHENRTSSAEVLGGIDPQTMEILRDRNRLDLELYEYAVQLFHAREADARVARDSAFAGNVEPNYFIPFPNPPNPKCRATIQSVSAEWVGNESSKVLEIAVGYKTRLPIEQLSLSVQVTGVKGDMAWNTSTWQECLELEYEPGRDCRAVFLAECELPRGLYFVTVALAEPRKFGFYEHCIDHATLFTVESPRATRSRYQRGMRSQEFSSTVVRNVNGP